jgi:hypothetical protein
MHGSLHQSINALTCLVVRRKFAQELPHGAHNDPVGKGRPLARGNGRCGVILVPGAVQPRAHGPEHRHDVVVRCGQQLRSEARLDVEHAFLDAVLRKLVGDTLRGALWYVHTYMRQIIC